MNLHWIQAMLGKKEAGVEEDHAFAGHPTANTQTNVVRTKKPPVSVLKNPPFVLKNPPL